MNDLLPQLICAHLAGDFLLQNDWMARNKHKSTLPCMVHVLCYALPFLIVCLSCPLIPWWLCDLILIQHFIQDRFQIHLRWMKFYGQTEPERWPTGPLCVDQAFHIGFIWIVTLFV